jgi:hypothetical protein
MSSDSPHVSVFRLRLGIILFALFWLPAYLLAPVVAAALGNESALVRITIFIMVIQTAIGLIGFWVAGSEIVPLVRHLPRKKIPKTVWRLFWTGSDKKE